MTEPHRSRSYANVMLDCSAREIRERIFSYAIPDVLADDIFAGTQVLVPFGKSGQVNGYVVSFSSLPPPGIETKAILEVLASEPLFDKDYVDFLRWVSDYYCASFSEVMSAAVPSFLAPRIKHNLCLAPGLNRDQLNQFENPHMNAIVNLLLAAKGGLAPLTLRQRLRKLTGANNAHFYRAVASLKTLSLIETEPQKINALSPRKMRFVVWTGQDSPEKRQQEIIDTLKRQGGQMQASELIKLSGTTRATLKRMSNAGSITLIEEEVNRNPLTSIRHAYENDRSKRPELTHDQAKVFEKLESELALMLANASGLKQKTSAGSRAPFWLLHGITGSGKTEIYLRLIEKTLQSGRTALLLVPEIALTPQLALRLTERFGEAVAVWHSALSPAERYDTWRRLKAGHAKILLGARSAILVDLPKLALIILDEEHDSSYKQTTPNPRYHAKETAIEKATRCGALLLLGSATPDVSTYFLAEQANTMLSLPQRVFSQPLPETRLVDMRQEFLNGNRSIFCPSLLQALEKTLAAGEQAIMLMNRRGFASHVFCRGCGFVLTCKNCSVTMVYHQALERYKSVESGSQRKQSRGFLACHHCGYRLACPDLCPSCQGPFIKPFGIGTQRIESDLRQYFPAARILRLDSDISAKRGAQEEILTAFSQGKADILIGTQMVAKGLDIERVTLVGVLAADAAFNMPDYRSVERGFQLLTQVAGRAGRGKHPGLVILQTYNTEMPALLWAKEHDYHRFYEYELANRQTFDYPPFSQLLRLVVACEDALIAERECEHLAEGIAHYVEERLSPEQMQILGPAPCLIERLRNKFRVHLLVKNKAGAVGRSLVAEYVRTCRFPEAVQVAIDVDALDLF